MYLLRFFIHGISSAAESIFCIFSRSNDSESELLVEENAGGYASVEETRSSHELLGLTAQYHNWLESKTAMKYAFVNLGAYLLVAVIGFSFVFEKWPIYDSLYFSVVVFTTVGYGDLSPTSDASRVFVIFFAMYGIVILGIFLGIVGEFILESNDDKMKKRIANARLKVMEQFGEDDTATPSEARTILSDVLAVVWAEAPVVLILAVLGAPIVYVEGWGAVEGVYWMVVTGTTIGFGDLGPTEMLTRCICLLWIPLAVAVLGELLGRIAGVYIDRRNDAMEARFLQRAMTLADLRRMDTDNDDRVSPPEFLCYMLVALQKVEKEEIDEVMALFKKLDKSNDGFISKEDLMTNFNLSIRPGVSVRVSDLRASVPLCD